MHHIHTQFQMPNTFAHFLLIKCAWLFSTVTLHCHLRLLHDMKLCITLVCSPMNCNLEVQAWGLRMNKWVDLVSLIWQSWILD